MRDCTLLPDDAGATLPKRVAEGSDDVEDYRGGLGPFGQSALSNFAAGMPFIPVSMLGDLAADAVPFTPNAFGGWAGRKPLAGPPVCVSCALSPKSPWYTGPFGAR